MKIAVFGHYGNGNLGDEAIVEAVIENCRKRFISPEMVGISSNPEDTSVRYGLPAFPIAASIHARHAFPTFSVPDGREGGVKGLIKKRMPGVFHLLKIIVWFLLLPALVASQIRFACQARHQLKSIDIVLISGSNQFLDNFGGPWAFPFHLLLWTLLAKTTNTRTVILSIGAGPITHRLSKIFIKIVLRNVFYYSFRDHGSASMVKEFYPAVDMRIYPDLAFSLLLKPKDAGKMSIGSMAVGINPMPIYDSRYWPITDEKKYNDYVTKLAYIADKLIARGYTVNLFHTQPKDCNVITDIMNAIAGKGSVGIISDYANTSGLLACMSTMDLVLATRFHGVLLSLYLSKPVLAICYGQKTFDAMRECGLADYAVDVENFTVDDVLARFDAMCARKDEISEKLKQQALSNHEKLQDQYDAVFLGAGQKSKANTDRSMMID